MTMKQLESKQALENRKYELAKAIRKLLDDYLKESTKDADERADLESEIIDLVSGEDEES